MGLRSSTTATASAACARSHPSPTGAKLTPVTDQGNPRIDARSLTKHYGAKIAVGGNGFSVRPGRMTGFLGPNGAGKSTTMRMIVGLDRPTSGSVTVDGQSYAAHRAPLHEVGALLEAKSVHPGRSARNPLARHSVRIGSVRVNEVIELTGLKPVVDERVGRFSLGMGQRLGLAAALLGGPETIILDEPVNGLDLRVSCGGVGWHGVLSPKVARFFSHRI